MIHLLSLALIGQSVALPDFPKSTATGIGLSDVDLYAVPLALKARYQNTFFHTEPRLDITDPPQALL